MTQYTGLLKKPPRKQPKPKLDAIQPTRGFRPELLIYLFLLLATLVIYGQVRHYDFVNFDDREVILGNVHVRDGLTLAGLSWAFTSFYAANWFPVTWISHMLDFQLFGLDPGWHHLTNVLIHALSTLLLFAVMKRMTGALWQSAFVAFVFALHPLHVESVAWVSERKDVLSAFFWFLTLWAYLDYVERPKVGRYALVLVAFSLGLMSKQMIVTLPFVLLLLDVWPLRRGLLVLEKVPLFALSIAASVVTYIVQRKSGAVLSLNSIPLPARAENALISYIAYLVNLIWPTGLSAFYPHPIKWPTWEVAGAGLLIVAVSAVVLRALRSRPYLAVGCFWYLGTLVPVIGLVQVGEQSRADRYTYVPLVGISIMLAWGMADVFKRWPRARTALAACSIAVCSVWVALTWVQIQYWKDSVALFRHALEVTSGNYLAHVNLAMVLAEQRNTNEALEHLYTAIEEKPNYADAHYNLGAVLGLAGRNDEAVAQFSETLRLRPNDPDVHYNLGNALVASGKMNEAAGEFDASVRLNPNFANAQFRLGGVLASLGRLEEAIPHLSEAVRLDPDLQQARQALERARLEQQSRGH